MKNKQWKKVTPDVWVCDDWAVEDCRGYADLYHNGKPVRDFKTVEQAKRGATQRTLDQVARWQEERRAKLPGLARLPVIQR